MAAGSVAATVLERVEAVEGPLHVEVVPATDVEHGSIGLGRTVDKLEPFPVFVKESVFEPLFEKVLKAHQCQPFASEVPSEGASLIDGVVEEVWGLPPRDGAP